MWKLKIAEGGPWLKSGNNHIGRETWEFDQNNGSREEREAVDAGCRNAYPTAFTALVNLFWHVGQFRT